jgi:hypothetical protein
VANRVKVVEAAVASLVKAAGAHRVSLARARLRRVARAGDTEDI